MKYINALIMHFWKSKVAALRRLEYVSVTTKFRECFSKNILVILIFRECFDIFIFVAWIRRLPHMNHFKTSNIFATSYIFGFTVFFSVTLRYISFVVVWDLIKGFHRIKYSSISHFGSQVCHQIPIPPLLDDILDYRSVIGV